MFFTNKCVFKEKLSCDTLDIQIGNLVHRQDLCTIQKGKRKSHVLILKRLHLWDISCGTYKAILECDELDIDLNTK